MNSQKQPRKAFASAQTDMGHTDNPGSGDMIK